MTKKKAIEVLTLWREPESVAEIEELIEASKLGIEALKRHLSAEGRMKNLLEIPLPGETEE